jgi:arylsulfatase
MQADWPLSPRDPEVTEWRKAEHKEWEAHRMAVYAAMVDRMDQGIGRVIEALKETGRFENTLILFLSDNGGTHTLLHGTNTRHGYFARGGTSPAVFPGGPDTYAAYGREWGHVSNTPFRLYKQWNHEGGVATPFIAHWPKGIQDHGALRHQPGHVIDIMATAVDLAGAAYPRTHRGHPILPMEGVSLLPAFKNKSLDREPIYFEHIGHRAVRAGNWKLVAERGKAWELYDMANDRTELNDLAGEYPSVVEQLRSRWYGWAERAHVNQ